MEIVSNARKVIFRPEAGAPVVAFPKGAEINDYGVNNEAPSIVVCNGTEAEPSWQGVDHDSGVVIVNEVPGEVAEMALLAFDMGGRSISALRRILTALESLGLVDQYTTSLGFVTSRMSKAGTMLDEFTGIVKRDDRDLVPVWQENGTYYVLTDGVRVIEPEILVRTYRNADGTKINLDSVPEGRPEES